MIRSKELLRRNPVAEIYINELWNPSNNVLISSKEFEKNDETPKDVVSSEFINYRNQYQENIDSLFSKATSGKEFSGLPFRTFPTNSRKFFKNATYKSNEFSKSKWNCTKWGVVTTIFAPPKQEAVRRFLYRKDWCVVVTGDKNKPEVRFHFWIMPTQSHRAYVIGWCIFFWLALQFKPIKSLWKIL